jgi:hypothetical protein
MVELRITQRDNPVKDVYDYIANENNEPDKAQPGDVILLGASKKDRGYYSNLAKFVKDKPWRVLFGEEYETPIVFRGSRQREEDILSEFSASQFRDAIADNNIKEIDSFLPEEILASEEYKIQVYKILGVQPTVTPLKESNIIKIIDNQMTKETKVMSKLKINDLINRVNSIYSK